MPDVQAPVPDPELKPKTAKEMSNEGELEGSITRGATLPDEIETDRDPQFARNGE